MAHVGTARWWPPGVRALAGAMRRCILLDRLLPNALLLRFTLVPRGASSGGDGIHELVFDLEGTLRIGGEYVWVQVRHPDASSSLLVSQSELVCELLVTFPSALPAPSSRWSCKPCCYCKSLAPALNLPCVFACVCVCVCVCVCLSVLLPLPHLNL